jgi:hypothetical protein
MLTLVGSQPFEIGKEVNNPVSGNRIGASLQTFSEQVSATQMRLPTDSAVAIQSQGHSLTLELMAELVMATIGSDAGSDATSARQEHQQ